MEGGIIVTGMGEEVVEMQWVMGVGGGMLETWQGFGMLHIKWRVPWEGQ